MSGVEGALAITGVVLASFQVLCSLIDHFDKGWENYQYWHRYRYRYETFRNDFHQQQIFFRQHLEALLSPLVTTDSDLDQMLNDTDSSLWKDEGLTTKLKQRLSRESELSNYMLSLKGIEEVQDEIGQKFKKSHDETQGTSAFRGRLKYEINRISFVFMRRKRNQLMKTLESHINRLDRILGNSDRLRTGREKRKEATLPIYFNQYRRQATNLHKAICRSMRCTCLGLHSSQFLLWRSNNVSPKPLFDKFTQSPVMKVYFPRKSQKWSRNPVIMQPDNDWYASDIEISKVNEESGQPQALSLPGIDEVPGQPPALIPAQPQAFPSPRNPMYSVDSHDFTYAPLRPSYQEDYLGESSSTSRILGGATKIYDLCAALENANHSAPCLGYLLGEDNNRVIIHRSTENIVSPSDVRRVVKLRDLIQSSQGSDSSSGTEIRVPKVTRLSIAIKLVETVLQLFDSPWLQDTWDKDDIHFFEDSSGSICYDKPFLVSDFISSRVNPKTPPRQYPVTALPSSVQETHTYGRTQAVLFSLGVVILELWFNQPIESCRWHRDYLNSNGEEHDYTRRATVAKWLEVALEEGGSTIHELMDACTRSTFGIAKPDLRKREVQMSIYTRVAEPLKVIKEHYA